MRQLVLAALLAFASILIAVGAGLVYAPAGFVVGGGLLAAWAFLTFSDQAETT